jgi:hypothetical protein
MKYRVRMDLSFENEAEGRTLMDYARGLEARAVSPPQAGNRDNAEISYFELELCRHDEGLPCTRLERVEVVRV